MPLSVNQPPYKIPEYSLTGDLLAFLTCGLQYRLHNRNSLPPSKPVQIWFGEFIHGVMEEAFLEWHQDSLKRKFPWRWDSEIREIELRINRRLKARGLNPPPRVFCPYDTNFSRPGLCPDPNHPHKLIASQRAEAAINTWGPHLFPLIDEAEVRLRGIRDMPDYQPRDRCNYYGITGVIDVISSVNLQNAPSGNLILHYLHQNSQLQNIIKRLSSPEYEIIIDYKGMRRPSSKDPSWEYHEWQILTYAWLRKRQHQSREVVAGIIFYINELAPSQEDMKELQNDVRNNATDVMPQGLDLQLIQDWEKNTFPPQLSTLFREQRSIRIIPVDKSRIQNALQEFDRVVRKIENSVLSEMNGNPITSSWYSNPLKRNCTTCDFKTFCRGANSQIEKSGGPYHPTVP
jgi:hypothetical protein